MRFVLTGIAKVAGTHIMRADLIKLATSKGHKVDPKVAWHTDYLVTDSAKWTEKRRMANMLNTSIITTNDYIDLLGGEIELDKTLGMEG